MVGLQGLGFEQLLVIVHEGRNNGKVLILSALSISGCYQAFNIHVNEMGIVLAPDKIHVIHHFFKDRYSGESMGKSHDFEISYSTFK